MRILLALTLAALAAPALGESPPAAGTPVQLAVGQRLDLCRAKLIFPCSMTRFICDAPTVATVEGGGSGPVLVGVGAGATQCSIYSDGNRRLLAITVSGAGTP